MFALDNYEGEEPLILSNVVETSIRDLVESIAELMNFKGKIVWDSSKPNGHERKPSDNSPLKTLIPSFEFTHLSDGLKTTIEWFEHNYESITRK